MSKPGTTTLLQAVAISASDAQAQRSHVPHGRRDSLPRIHHARQQRAPAAADVFLITAEAVIAAADSGNDKVGKRGT